MIPRVRLWFCTVLLAFCVQDVQALDPRQLLSQYGRQVWQTDSGLPQNTVRALAQTPDGYIWLGTDDGLVRFNGVEFKVFNAESTPQLPGNSVRGLTVDGAGRLWVVSASGLAVREGQDRFQQVRTGEAAQDASVRFVRVDHRQRVWVSAGEGMCLVRGSRCQAVVATKGMSVTRESGFAEAPDGSVWLAGGTETVHLDGVSLARLDALKTGGAAEILAQWVDRAGHLLVGTSEGLEEERQKILVPVPIQGALGSVAVNAIVEARDGSMWLGTSAGLAHGGYGSFAVSGERDKHVAVQTLFRDREGALWAGTAAGVARVSQDGMEMFGKGDPSSGSSLLACLEDREGNVWLGTESDGLTMLHEQKFTTYTTAEGLSGNVVRAVLEDAHGTVWVGTDGAGLNRKTAHGFAALTTREGLSSNVILSLAGAANGDLWVGTPTGLNRVRGAEIKIFTAEDGLADDFIRSLLVDAQGNVWAGTRHGLTKIAADRMTTFTTMDGLGSDYIGVMVQARDGDLWIGTSGGLTQMHDGRFRNFSPEDDLQKNVVTAIHADADGGLWLGRNGGGLARMRNGITVALPAAANLPGNISSVLEDGEKRLWIGSRSGIYRVARGELERLMDKGAGSVALTSYDTADGMRVRECSSGGHPAAVRMRDGTLWFATLRGVSVVDPAHLHENAVAPQVAVETVLVNDAPYPGGGEIVLAPGSQRVEFQYAGLSFVAPGKVRYRYKLEGFDRDWIDAGVHRAAFYTNLRPGQYAFHVAARNNDGVWSEADAAVAMRVRPFFWQTVWFYGLLLLAVTAAAYAIYAWRVRRVAAMYQGVMEERSRIAREIHDTLAQGIVSISLQLEVIARLLGTSPEAARAQLQETRTLVRQSLADARSSIWNLREEGSEELPVRIGRWLKVQTDAAGVHGRLAVTGSYRAMPREVEDEVLRIAQEAVTNALRHGQGSLVEVTLGYDLKKFRLAVRDDGRGFDAAAEAPAGHFGMQGMRERTAKIGARFQVESGAGAGTQIVVERPLV